MSLRNLLSRFTGPTRGPSMHQSDLPEPGLTGIPDLVEPLLGWRVWRVWTPLAGTDSFPILSSVILDTPWTPRRKVTAEHSQDLGAKCHGLLEPGCSCGVYAFKDVEEAFAYLVKVRDRLLSMSVEVSLGTVSLWGRVNECERGYKAQFGYPHHVYVPVRLSRLMPKITSSFGIPIGVYSSTTEEEISIPVSFGRDGQERAVLKKTRLLVRKDFSFPVGLYDQTALSAWVKQPPLPASGPPPPGLEGR